MDRDVLALIEVDVPDTTESREWLRAYARDVLLERLQAESHASEVEHLIVGEEEVRDED